jgi:hypothetical protein
MGALKSLTPGIISNASNHGGVVNTNHGNNNLLSPNNNGS